MTTTPDVYAARLETVRAELRKQGLDGFLVPHTDEHFSEYVGDYARRLFWLTGFDGSQGTAVVRQGDATLFVNAIYDLQARRQVDTCLWTVEILARTPLAAWLGDHVRPDQRIGYDPWLHTEGAVATLRRSLAACGGELVALGANLIDAVWPDQPHRSLAPIAAHPRAVTGEASSDKRRRMAESLTAAGAELAVLCALDSIAWTFNIRGADIPHTPLALAYAVVDVEGGADLFTDPAKVTPALRDHLGDAVRLHPRDAFADFLATLSGRRVAADPRRTVSAVYAGLQAAGATIIEARDPAVLPKAVKNPVEVAGQRAAHVRDGEALSRFLHWLAREAPGGSVTELSAARRLRDFREAGGTLKDLSFGTISGFGPNGAIVHYQPKPETDLTLAPGGLYLLDSGGQYLDGTTDVTRTVAIGVPTAEMCDRYTRVLKGHIALAGAVFPAGTRGSQLDALARQYLWAVGVNYPHATGHGVGTYLCVHEGPHRVLGTAAYLGLEDEPLAPGMIVSNEPGYYKAEAYGIRIENLMVVVERQVHGAEMPMLGFEPLTLAPIDRTPIDLSLMSPGEIAWLDAYHRQVETTLGPRIDGPARAWLAEMTRPLALTP